MASTAGAKADRPSFAKIAAAGIKPPGSQINPTSHDNTQHQHINSSPPDGSNIVSHSTGSHPKQFTPKQKKLVPLMAKEQRTLNAEDNTGLQISVHNVDTASAAGEMPRAVDPALLPRSDEAGTQVSSSSGSGKPPSIDGKSVTSGTTFALDEKESLRPDDSASVKAGEDEDLFSPSGSGLPSSRIGSEDGTKAFRDQLREISRMDPSRQAESRPSMNRGSSQGVLYVPPPGPGIEAVPDANRNEDVQDSEMDAPPDPRLLEALESPKDRIMVLKLEQDFVDFVKDPKEASLTLPQLNGYHRMLAHRLADYYMLGHVVEDSTAVQIYKTVNCRLAPPLTAVATPSTAASTPPPTGPQMKILRRGDNVGPTIANGSNAQSKTGSENGESGNDDEKKKYPLSREEREAKYEAARKRIMGSAKPSETSDELAEKDISRSSSTAPRKTKKKQQRNNSDDDFEARSAYSAYYATPFTSAGPVSSPYGFTHVGAGQESQFPPSGYAHQIATASSQQYGAPVSPPWQNQTAFQQQQQTPASWMPNAQQSYDLSNDFQRAMSLQSGSLPSPQVNAQPSWQTPQSQRFPGQQQQQWQGPNSYASGYQSHAAPSYADNFRPSSSSSQNQPYAYGQLPSQTFPGRPPSNLEHPLPGSYKGKHFNPQSQSFVPNFGVQPTHNMGTPPSLPPFTGQVPQAGNAQYGAYGMPSPMQQPSKPFQQQVPQYQQHPSLHQQQAPFQSQQQSQHSPYHQHQPSPMPSAQPQPQTQVNISGQRAPSTGNGQQPLTHPLPQPVFPRQPSPNVPLPPKPSDQSSIAKWGTPSSLPAKPPPANEAFDVARYAHNQRQQGSRVSSGGSTSTAAGQVQGFGR